MDTITHTLFGLTAYGALNKKEIPNKEKYALFFTAVAGSNIPDIDVIMRITEIGRIMDLMWHRGITHSIFMIPIWTLFLTLLCSFIWKVKTKRVKYVALFSVSLHVLSDVLNTWGTGILEPFSSVRISLGVLSIVDFVIWGAIILGFMITLFKRSLSAHKVYRTVWVVIAIHVLLQGMIGFGVYQSSSTHYEKVVLRAEFMPWHYTVIGKNENIVEISTTTIFTERNVNSTLVSDSDVDLSLLYENNPKAKVLMDWAPFVIIVNNEKEIGIYDPRFFINGESFLYESIQK